MVPTDKGNLRKELAPTETTSGKTAGSNPAAPSVPTDFSTFDFTEMEQIGNDLFHAKDEWVRKDEGSSTMRQSGALSADQASVEEWRKATEPPVESSIATFLKNRMVVEMGDCAQMEEAVGRSLVLMSKKGTTRDNQLEECGLEAWRALGTKGVGRSNRKFPLWPKFPLGDCEAQEFLAGRLTFRLIDYGDEIKLSLEMRDLLGPGDEIERNQCDALSFSSGYEWVKQGNPNRPPGSKRVLLFAQNHRFVEMADAKAVLGKYHIPAIRFEAEMRIIAHEPASVNHERDLISPNRFLRGNRYERKTWGLSFWMSTNENKWPSRISPNGVVTRARSEFFL